MMRRRCRPSATATTAAHTTTEDAAVDPFVGVTIADSNVGATDTLTITLSAAGNGTLSGSAANLNDGGGVYTLAAALPGSITSELDARFSPRPPAPRTSAPPPPSRSAT